MLFHSVAYLQVLGMVVGPGQEHGCKQVAGSHKHCIHFGDVHPNLLAAAGPVRFHYSMKGEKWTTTLNGWPDIVLHGAWSSVMRLCLCYMQ